MLGKLVMDRECWTREDVGPMFLSAAKNKVPNVVRDDNEN